MPRLRRSLAVLSLTTMLPMLPTPAHSQRGTPPIEHYDPNAKLTPRTGAAALVCEVFASRPGGFGVINLSSQVVPKGTTVNYTLNGSDDVAGTYTTRNDLDVGARETIRRGNSPRSCRLK